MPHSGCTSRSRTTPHRAQVFALPTMLWSRQVTEVVGHIMGVRKPWRRHVAPRRTPGTVQRALLDGPKGQNLSLGPKKIFLLIRWSQSTHRSLRDSLDMMRLQLVPLCQFVISFQSQLHGIRTGLLVRRNVPRHPASECVFRRISATALCE